MSNNNKTSTTMAKWFETKARYERVKDDGTTGKVTEVFMVDALSFAEAEARTLEEVAPFTSGELEVVSAKITNIREVVAGYKDKFFEGDKWYTCKLEFITLDEKTAKEKRTAYNMLIKAADIDAAKKNLTKAMEGSMQDYDIKSITESKVIDVWDYKPATTQE